MTVEIVPVRDKAELKAFIDVPVSIYSDDPAWCRPLDSEIRDILDRTKNPYFDHAEAEAWIARRDGRAIGRITAQVDRFVQEHMGQGTGQFGFFETIDDLEVSKALLDTAHDWLKARGMNRSLGPFSLGIWDEIGVLVEGFEHPQVVMTPHARPYYIQHLMAHGYAKEKDLLAFLLLDSKEKFSQGIPLVKAFEKNPKFKFRMIDMHRFKEEVALILDIIQDAWSQNWGFVPMTDREVMYAALKLRPIISRNYVWICEFEGEAVGFIITIPDVNEIIRDFHGKLGFMNGIKLLWRLYKKQVSKARTPLMGVRKSLQQKREGALVGVALIEYSRRSHSNTGSYMADAIDLSWILEDNSAIIKILEKIESEIYKRWRIVSRPI